MNFSKSSDENRYSSMTDLSLVKSVKKSKQKSEVCRWKSFQKIKEKLKIQFRKTYCICEMEKIIEVIFWTLFKAKMMVLIICQHSINNFLNQTIQNTKVHMILIQLIILCFLFYLEVKNFKINNKF